MADSVLYQVRNPCVYSNAIQSNQCPASLQEIPNTRFKSREEYSWYMDNILLHNGDTEGEQQAIVGKVLQQCVEHGLGVNLLKSNLHVHEIIFLSHVIKC